MSLALPLAPPEPLLLDPEPLASVPGALDEPPDALLLLPADVLAAGVLVLVSC
ncbi:MAG TPA: hypothetical protein VFM01_08245 [Nakamurella sp.]|nr:hypothetical protein [Nakamurella sp.]